MSNALLGIILLLSTPTLLRAESTLSELKTVKSLNLERYQGLWYELYRLPNRFEEGCTNVSAQYGLKDESVEVINTCMLEGTGEIKKAKGTAFVVDQQTRATLKVSFVPFLQRWGLFAGDYNVLKIGPNYEYALVGSKDREYLWILSRTPSLNDDIVNKLKDHAKEQGYNLQNLIKTPHS